MTWTQRRNPSIPLHVGLRVIGSIPCHSHMHILVPASKSTCKETDYYVVKWLFTISLRKQTHMFRHLPVSLSSLALNKRTTCRRHGRHCWMTCESVYYNITPRLIRRTGWWGIVLWEMRGEVRMLAPPAPTRGTTRSRPTTSSTEMLWFPSWTVTPNLDLYEKFILQQKEFPVNTLPTNISSFCQWYLRRKRWGAERSVATAARRHWRCRLTKS